MRERHAIGCFVSGIANHETLISSSDFLLFSVEVNSVSDLGRLFIESDNDCGSTIIHSDVDGVIADLFDGLTDDGLDVGFCCGADLPEDHADGVFDGSLACNHGVGVFGKAGIEDGIGDIVTQFIGMATGDAF